MKVKQMKQIVYRSMLFILLLQVGSILKGQSVDIQKLHSPILFKGDSVTAYRDPLALYEKGIIYLYFTLTEIEPDGKIYMYTAFSKSKDLLHWSPVKKITAKDQSLNYSSPGSIIRYQNEWIMCLQTYPRKNYSVEQMPKYGDENSRLFLMHSTDLENWSAPEIIKVKGDTVDDKNMGRMIDPFLLQDQQIKNKWWIFYKQNGASRSYSYDLKHWVYNGHIAAGENVCIIFRNDAYIMFHSPPNGIGIKRSKNLMEWKDESQVLTLGQNNWDWAKGRITAGYVLDIEKNEKNGYRYLLFFHGSGPKKETEGDFDKNASIGLAWSKDLESWEWLK